MYRYVTVLEKLSGGGGGEFATDSAATVSSEWTEPYDLENSEAVACAVLAFSAVGDACAADPGRKVAPPPDPAVAAADPDDDDEDVLGASVIGALGLGGAVQADH